FRVLTDDFVTIEDGTGIVHLAPAFGEVDFFICQREGIEPVCAPRWRGSAPCEISEKRRLSADRPSATPGWQQCTRISFRKAG
ncbi:MAG TPA: hypothetical protein VLV54_00270, partial [Thermoanaerobaculia bacterium]|nr:hypothetical protein [Thermoanaerobaculia bacterium]